MSWGGIPFFIYCLEAEEHDALMSGAFREEYNSGYTRSTPDYWVKMFRERWHDEERKLYSLGVRLK